MNQLWNELVWMHDRTPYRLLRSVELCLRDITREARLLEGKARERNDVKAVEKWASWVDANHSKADQIKKEAISVMRQSYQGFEPEEYLALRAQAKKLDQDAKQAKQGGKTDLEKRLRASAQEIRSKALRLRTLDIPLDDRINDYVQERGKELELPVWCKWHVGEKFKNALRAYAKKIRYAPRRSYGLDSIHIEQRTDSGTGWPVKKLFERRAPFSMRPEVERGGDYNGWKAPAWMGLKGERIPLQVTLHRPFPDGAIVKRYSLLGHYEKATRTWEWRMLFQLEIPPARVLYPTTNRRIAVDAGWRAHRGRAIGEEGIRIMTIFDGFNAYEVIIPFDLSNAAERHRRGEDPEKSRIDLREAWAIKSQRQLAMEDCKAAIAALDTSHWPEEARRLARYGKRMRNGGLESIQRILMGQGTVCALIDERLAEDRLAWVRQRYIEKRWLRARNEILRLVAVELADQCDVIRWEGELGLRNMAESGGRNKRRRANNRAATGEWEERSVEERVTEAAQKWRVMANLSKLRQWMREAAERRGCEIEEADTAYSSQICCQCFSKIEPSVNLIVRCEHGHMIDQDVNTARYYWNQFDENSRAVAEPLAEVKRSQLRRVIKTLKS